MQNLLKGIKVTRVMNAVAAGTSNQNGSTLDMSGWDGVLFVAQRCDRNHRRKSAAVLANVGQLINIFNTA